MTNASTSSYVLRYFDLPGLAQNIRTLLNLAGAQWTEEHPEWPAAKADQPFGRMPVLIEKNSDGEVVFELSESVVIERYILRTFGLLPTDLKAAARQEQLRDQFTDILLSILAHTNAGDDSKEKTKEKAVEILETSVSVHSKLLRENGNNGHFFGDKISYADISFYNLLKFIQDWDVRKNTSFAAYVANDKVPEFEKLIATVEAEPALQSHFAAH
ncbi:hypothetical protein FBU59_004204 [Linderina macrospora]|uniref:Uncharacterized protein n=1 Tax=Linderina macrospora TaxID=4868 RepID=A0ACC1J6F8_9FUNG|nr:hypothetical protein FBU59_004204 [Linderina macrospora]